MDWKYKHFHQKRAFAASPDTVAQAASRFVAESLGWTTQGAADGFTAEGSSFGHAAKAVYRFQSAPGGTKVDIDLLVERAGVTGFMLFDVGGYYNIQISKWLDGIQWNIHQSLTGAAEQTQSLTATHNRNAARLFNGCLLLSFIILGLWFFGNFISAALGLVTGTLYLWGKGGTLVLHGMLARVIAVAIIMFGLFLAWGLLKSRSHPLTRS
jgi:hypothetical protein